MKKLAVLVFCLVLFTCAASASANDESLVCGDYEYTILDDGTARIDAHRNQIVTKVVIPSELDGHPVSEIGEKAFYKYFNVRIESITISEGVTSIGARAFLNQIELKSISIPDSVVSIGDFAFESCGLKEFCLPAGVIHVGEGFLTNCRFLQSLRVAEGNPSFTAINNTLIVCSYYKIIK